MATKKQRPAKTSSSKKHVASKSRLNKYQQARRRKRRFSNAAWAIAALAVVGAILYFTVGSYLGDRNAVAAMTSGSCRYDERSDPGRSGIHIDNPTFSVEPPAGGAHTPAVAGSGDYSAAAQLPGDGQLVHALEHGYINIWYRPSISPEDLEALKALQRENRVDTLLIPRATLSTPVAATAWHKRLLCDQVEIEALQTFTDAYVNEGPERVPHR